MYLEVVIDCKETFLQEPYALAIFFSYLTASDKPPKNIQFPSIVILKSSVFGYCVVRHCKVNNT